MELTKLYTEAKDNVKFLTTLERHFKIIANGDLTAILETLSPMMNGLRMVWIISRHYSDDKRMASLLEDIANEIADKVAAVIDVRTIFSLSSDERSKKIKLAKAVLTQWHDVYVEVCACARVCVFDICNRFKFLPWRISCLAGEENHRIVG